MLIALDYDGTYTRAPKFWDQFIKAGGEAGHDCVCITMRYPHEPIEMPCPVVYTSRQAKAVFLADHGHPMPDIWIDDQPHWIFTSSN